MYYYNMSWGMEDGHSEITLFHKTDYYSPEAFESLCNRIALELVKKNIDRWNLEKIEMINDDIKNPSNSKYHLEFLQEIKMTNEEYIKRKEMDGYYNINFSGDLTEMIIECLINEHGFSKLEYDASIWVDSGNRIAGIKKCEVCGKDVIYAKDRHHPNTILFHKCKVENINGTDIGR